MSGHPAGRSLSGSAVASVVMPTLVRIGHGWAEESVSVAQEHMATSVLRRILGWLFRVDEVRGAAPGLVVARVMAEEVA